MTTENWQTKNLSVASLHLDSKNPRLGRETLLRAPREIIQYLFEHDKAIEVAQSIASRGYFPNEPLLAIKENDRYVVVEGNRRLAALKALREPGLLEGSIERQVERLSRRITDTQGIVKVPVTIAPSRRATDRQIAGRHIGSPVLAWQAENRAKVKGSGLAIQHCLVRKMGGSLFSPQCPPLPASVTYPLHHSVEVDHLR